MRRRFLPFAIAAALLAPPAAASAGTTAPGLTVKGRLSGRAGTTVLAISPAGVSKSAKLNAAGNFSFRFTKSELKGVTLQLVAKSGQYAGPIVLRAGAGKAYSRLGATAVDLGALQMRAGYARILKPLPNAALDLTKWATADKTGKPIGAGKLGFVKTTTAAKRALAGPAAFRANAAAAANGAGDDPDGDGIPNTFDADDNGNGTMDNTDAVSAKSAGSNAGLFTTLFASFDQALNANAGEVTQEQIDALVGGENTFNMIFYFDDGHVGGKSVKSVDVDCYAATYCARGTGTAIIGGLSESGADLPRDTTWSSYSPNGSGLPNLENMQPHVYAMGLQPRVPTSQIHPGDSFAVNFRMTNGTVVTIPTSLSSYFVTTPAIKNWSDGTTTTEITYPVADSSAGIFDAPTGQVSLNLWRPQRAAIAGAGETGNYTDMGRLHYGVSLRPQGVQTSTEIGCGGHFSGLSSDLVNDYVATSTDPGVKLFPLRDTSADAAPNASRTLGFTLDVAGCLTAAGVDPTGLTVEVTMTAAGEGRPGGMDRAAQNFTVQLP